MTLRQVSFSIDNINKELGDNRAFDASLHDKVLNTPKEKVKTELTEKQKLAIEADRKKFFSKEK